VFVFALQLVNGYAALRPAEMALALAGEAWMMMFGLETFLCEGLAKTDRSYLTIKTFLCNLCRRGFCHGKSRFISLSLNFIADLLMLTLVSILDTHLLSCLDHIISKPCPGNVKRLVYQLCYSFVI